MIHTKEELDKISDIDFVEEIFKSLNYDEDVLDYTEEEITTAWENVKNGLSSNQKITEKEAEIIKHIFELVKYVDYWYDDVRKKVIYSTVTIEHKINKKLKEIK